MDTTTTEIYTHGHTRALHNARPISQAALIETLTRERDEARTECEEQARLNGMGAEREAALITRTEAAAAALAKARNAALEEAIQKTDSVEVYATRHISLPEDVKTIAGMVTILIRNRIRALKSA